MSKLNALGVTLFFLTIATVNTLYSQSQATKKTESQSDMLTAEPLNMHLKKSWDVEWSDRQDEFNSTKKMLTLTGPSRAGGVSAISDGEVVANSRGTLVVQVPVAPNKILAVRGWVRERMQYPAYPWHECPFALGLQCGQVPPNAPVAPGGAAFLPYNVAPQLDGTTKVSADCLNWSGHLIRVFRLEIDY